MRFLDGMCVCVVYLDRLSGDNYIIGSYGDILILMESFITISLISTPSGKSYFCKWTKNNPVNYLEYEYALSNHTKPHEIG